MFQKYKWITITLVALTLVFGYVGEVWHHGQLVSEHLFTEMIATLMTVVGIEVLLQWNKKRSDLPRRVTAYIDVSWYVIGAVDIWYDAFRSSVPKGNDPQTVEAFFTPATMKLIWTHLDLHSTVQKSIPPDKWVDRLVRYGQWLKSGGDTVLSRNSNLDAQVYADVHSLTEGFLASFLPILRQALPLMMKTTMNSVPHLLSNAPEFQRNQIDAMLRLVQWCKKEHAALTKLRQDPKHIVGYRAYRADYDPSNGIDPFIAKAILQLREDAEKKRDL